jgi:hypothetical protein
LGGTHEWWFLRGGLADVSGGQSASYFYCPTGNQADGPWGSAAAGNPFGLLGGVSVQSFPGVPVAVLGGYVMNKQIGVATLDAIEASGGTINPEPLPGLPFHAELSGLTEEQMLGLFVVQPNPMPGALLPP